MERVRWKEWRGREMLQSRSPSRLIYILIPLAPPSLNPYYHSPISVAWTGGDQPVSM